MKKRLHILITIIIAMAITLGLGTAIYANTSTPLSDGLYKVTVPDPAKMCKILEEDNNTCNLIVKDGKMTAIVRLNSDGYDKVYVGTKEEAAAADPQKWIKRTEEKRTVVDEGISVTTTICSYEIPVSELGTKISIATHSINKGDESGANYVKGWYDREFTFSEPRSFTAEESLAMYNNMMALTADKEALQISCDDLQQKYDAEKAARIAAEDAAAEEEEARLAAETAKKNADTTIANLTAKIKVMGTKVSGVKATASKSHKITVKWTKNSSLSGYRVYRATSLSGKYTKVSSTSSSTATIKNHKKGKTYYYKVIGYKKVAGSYVYSKDSTTIAIKAK